MRAGGGAIEIQPFTRPPHGRTRYPKLPAAGVEMQMLYLLRWTLVCIPLVIGLPDACAKESSTKLVFRVAFSDPAPDLVKHQLPGGKDVVYVSDVDVINGSHVERVSFYRNDAGERVVGLTFSDEGASKLAEATSKNLPPVDTGLRTVPPVTPGEKFKMLAILFDGKVITAPRILAKTSDKCVVSGKFDDDDLLRIFSAIVLGKKSLSE